MNEGAKEVGEHRFNGGSIAVLGGVESCSIGSGGAGEVGSSAVECSIFGEKERACIDFCGGHIGSMDRGGGSGAMAKGAKEVDEGCNVTLDGVDASSIGIGGGSDEDCCVRSDLVAGCGVDLGIGEKERVFVDYCGHKGSSLDNGGGSGAMTEGAKEVNGDKVCGCDSWVMAEAVEEGKDDKAGSFVAECSGLQVLDKVVSDVKGEMGVGESLHPFNNIGSCLDKVCDSGVNEDGEACDVSVMRTNIVKEKNGELSAQQQENNCFIIEDGVSAEASDTGVKEDCNLNNVGSFDVKRQAQCALLHPDEDHATFTKVSLVQRRSVGGVNRGASLARQESSNLVPDEEALAESLDSFDVGQNNAAGEFIDKHHLVGSELDNKELLERSCSTVVESSDFQGNDSSAADMASTSNAKDSCESPNCRERTNQKPDPLIVFRRSNPKRAASTKNAQTEERYNQKAKMKNVVIKTNEHGDTSMVFLGNIIKIKSARKRSCLPRTTRRSGWGEIASLVHCFKQTDMVNNKVSYRRNMDTSIRKPQFTHKVKKFPSSSGRNAISTDSMHVKNHKFGASASLGPVELLDIVKPAAKVSVPVLSDHVDILATCNKDGEADQRVSDGKNEIDVQLLQQDGHQGDRDVESTLTQDISGENMLGECPGFSSLVLTESVMHRHLLGPESSPDSVVYNPLMDNGIISSETTTPALQNSELCEIAIASEIDIPVDLHASFLNNCKSSKIPDIAFSVDLHLQHKKEDRCPDSDQHAYPLSEQDPTKDNLHDTRNRNMTEGIKKYIRKENRRKKYQNGPLPSNDAEKATRKGTMLTSTTPDATKIGALELNYCESPSRLDFNLETSELPQSNACSSGLEDKGLLPVTKGKGTKFHCTNKEGLQRGKSSTSASTRGRQKKIHRSNKGITQSLHKSIMKEETQILDSCPEPKGGMNIISGSAGNEQVLIGAYLGVEKEPYLSQSAWVQCDECLKWRCISTALADMINETNCTWTCADNSDKAFADCSIPQEKSNKEINVELGISDDDDKSCEPSKPGIVNSKIEVSQPSSWTPIKTNLYLQRSRRTQTVDEIMVCYCKPPSNGSLGCGDGCLNRILNIECAKGTCPCGDLCSNQQFQKRKYAKLKQILCGKKGFGLQLLQDVSCGQFLIEYVGEVLDLSTYEARQRYYASRGQKHFYFMTLKGGEVIDACAKGNLGRFINHSCNPNCRTEKWMVNGEVCIGLFALKDIKKGEEVTFDYNYERIFGAAAKKCICGSSGCRGYLGGNPSDSDVIVQSDSGDEYPEPVIVPKDNSKKLQKDGRDFAVLKTATENDEELTLPKKELIQSPKSSAVPESGNAKEALDNICRPLSSSNPLKVSYERPTLVEHEETISHIVDDVQISKCSSELLNNVQIGEATFNPSFDTHLEVPSQTCIAASDTIADSAQNVVNSESIQIYAEPSCSQIKSSSCHSVKKSKSQKNKKVAISENSKRVHSVAGSSYDGVERELNGLLSVDGGISRRRDSIKGYLKLLNFTAAAGDNIGGASQSVRDLSLILDALLKTQSRRVLVEVINMNGLQLLHNILKQNRTKFNRTPVVRKLLKVLHDLAEKDILKPEHMDKSPPCSEMESFRETIWALTKHDDNQVHHTAIDFRKRWLPRVIRQVEPSDKDKYQMDSDQYWFNMCQALPSRVQLDQGARNSDAITCVNESECQPKSCIVDKTREASQDPGQLVQSSLPLTGNNHTSVKKTHKRKSRWDQPSEEPNSKTFCFIQDQTPETGLETVKATMLQPAVGPQPQNTGQNNETRRTRASSISESEGANDLMKCVDDGPPPGFGTPQNDNFTGVPEAKPIGSEVIAGYPQQKYLPNLHVSYGMPVNLVQQLGTPEVGDSLTHQHQNWVVAPGMPFYPFPPLPPYPRGELDTSKHMKGPSCHKIRGNAKRRLGKRCNADGQATDHALSSATGEMPTDMVETQHRQKFVRGNCGIRFPHSDRWSNHQHQNRWPRSREGSNGRFRGGMRETFNTGFTENGRAHQPFWPQRGNNFGS